MSLTDFAGEVFSHPFIFFTVVITLTVAFVNGWTDAPNAIASSVVTRALRLDRAVIIAAIADFAGSVIIGIFSSRVIHTVMNIADFGDDKRASLIALCAAMCSVVIWAVSAWKFGIPTSESHALIAGLTGASIAINGGFSGINPGEWVKVIYGLVISTGLGFFSGFVISKLTVMIFKYIEKSRADAVFRGSQIAASILMAFMHGAQDSQKFAGIIALIISLSQNSSILSDVPLWITVLCSVIIALGTATGGARIIKAVGMDMVKLRADQGFSADLAGAICLFLSTIFGLPVSTTHTKTSAVMGVGVAKSPHSINWGVAGEMVLAWLFTFPGCGLLGWAMTCFFLKIF